jgi:hypothetical protein
MKYLKMTKIEVNIGDEIKYALVSNTDAENIKQLKWRSVKRRKKDGTLSYSYPMTSIKNKVFSMHQIILGPIPDDKDVIDHINGDKFDNQRSNLRFLTFQENAINFQKNKKNGTYLGVYWLKDREVYRCSYNSKYLGCFDTEIEAATCYDAYLLFLGVNSDLLNFSYTDEERKKVLEDYKDKYEEKEFEKEKSLPKGITQLKNGKYYLQMQRNGKKVSKTVKDLDLCIKLKEEIEKEFEKEEKQMGEEKIKKLVQVNEEGLTYITCKKSDNTDFIVYIDADKANEICKYTWTLGSNNYPCATINKTKNITMHRWLWETYKNKIDDKNCIDHINKKDFDSSHTIDNRLENLREATYSLNNHNKQITNKFGYKGVIECSDRKGWYTAQVNKEGNRKYSKNYKTVEEAALAYNLLALEVYGEHAHLNKVPEGIVLKEKERKNKYDYIQYTTSGSWRVKIPKFSVNKTFKFEEEAVAFRNQCFSEVGEDIPKK